jgi:hypothetical protein
MRLVVLGAGASYGATRSNPVPTPMVNWFFDAAQRLGLMNGEYGVKEWRKLEKEVSDAGGDIRRAYPDYDPTVGTQHLAVLKGFLHQQIYIPTDDYIDRPIDIERVMGLIEGEQLGYHEMRRINQSFSHTPAPGDVLEGQLYFVLCATLVAATRGLACPYHAAIAKWLNPEDAVLSFNYDLLMDRALVSRGDWQMDDGYRVQFHRMGRYDGAQGKWRKPKRRRSSIPLYKLHGSLNWLYCRVPMQTVVQIDPDAVSMRPPNRTLYCLQDLNGSFDADFPLYEWWGRYEHEDENFIYDLHSLIVPPAITKPYRDFESLIGHLWGFATIQLLWHVRELYLIGYSLREADLRSWWLFRKAAVEGNIERVIVVDPSDEVFARVQRVFDRSEVIRGPSGIVEFAGSLA